jgi:hypothetical protein
MLQHHEFAVWMAENQRCGKATKKPQRAGNCCNHENTHNPEEKAFERR